jgi:hypothetical protein
VRRSGYAAAMKAAFRNRNGLLENIRKESTTLGCSSWRTAAAIGGSGSRRSGKRSQMAWHGSHQSSAPDTSSRSSIMLFLKLLKGSGVVAAIAAIAAAGE